LKKVKRFFKERLITPIALKGKPKIFCIGMNKTGTTSLKKTFSILGYTIGNQRNAERLLPDCINRDYKPIIKYVISAQVFQDIPFSLPNTYIHLSKRFPNAYFILTVRDNPEQWVNSITNFHSKKFGNGKIPTKKQLVESTYVYKGFMWDALRAIAPVNESNPYNKEVLKQAYIDYNNNVVEFFNSKDIKFLKINLSEKGGYQKLISFLGITSPFDDFPWENKTSDLDKNK
jgi:hypothetical protein